MKDAPGPAGPTGPAGASAPQGGISGQLVGCNPGTDFSGYLVYVPGRAFSVFTGPSGAFQMENIPPGSYDLSVEHNGQIVAAVTGVRAQVVGVTARLDTNVVAVGQSTTLRIFAQVLPAFRARAERIFSWHVDVLNTNGVAASANYAAMLKPAMAAAAFCMPICWPSSTRNCLRNSASCTNNSPS